MVSGFIPIEKMTPSRDYWRPRLKAKTTSPEMTIEPAEDTSFLVASRALNKIGSLSLKWPLPVEIFKFGNYYIAEEHEFSLWSDGATIKEALDGIQAFFLHEYQRYIDTPNEVMDLIARREKKKYNRWVKT